MSAVRGGKKGMRRRPLTSDMLLPLSPAQVRRLSLAAHLALVALEKGEGKRGHLLLLAEVICRTSLLSAGGSTEDDASVYEQADGVMARLLDSERPDDRWSTCAADSEVLARVLTIHDQLLARVPRHRLYEVQAQLRRAAAELPPSSWDGMPAWCRPGAPGV